MSEGQAVSETAGGQRDADFWQRRAFEIRLLNILPDLRGFARFLTGNPTEADDLVQDTMVRALGAYRQFDLDTNMKAWTFTIMRNLRINGLRRKPFEEGDPEEVKGVAQRPNQEDSVELKQVMRAMTRLSEPHRHVIALVRGAGCSYDEAAQIMNCNIGTIKSRLNRADAALRALLGPEFSNAREERISRKSPSAPRFQPALTEL